MSRANLNFPPFKILFQSLDLESQIPTESGVQPHIVIIKFIYIEIFLKNSSNCDKLGGKSKFPRQFSAKIRTKNHSNAP